MLQLFREITQNLELIWALAMKDLRVRYKRSVLGFLWALFHPLLMMVVYSIVFSTILGRGMENYPVFLISGIFPWTFFSQSANFSVSAIISNSTLIKKVSIDKSVFLVSAVLANLINFILSLFALVLLILALRFPFHWTWVYFPVPLAAIIVFSLGFGFIVATANVFFRDVSHIIQILLSAWFYLSAIIFPLEIIPEKYQIILKLNPMLYIIDGFHSTIFYGAPPDPRSMALAFASGIAVLVIGYRLFRRHQDAFIYYL